GVAVAIAIALWIEVAREALDQPGRHLQLSLVDLDVPAADLVRRPDLVGEVHLFEGEHALPHPETAEMLAVPHDEGRDRDEPRVLERAAEECVDALGPVLRAEVVR